MLLTSGDTTYHQDFILIDGEIAVNKSTVVNGIQSYEVDSHLLYTNSCALTQFELVDVYNTTGSKSIAAIDYASLL